MAKQQELCIEVNKRAPSFLESGEWTDCKFVVGAEPHQVVVGGYKLVMAMASPVFEAMFYGSLAETTDHIPIVDVEPEIFKAMLRYMYTGNINITSFNEAMQLCYIAKKYMMHHFLEECSNYLQNNVNLENVCQIYEHSELFEDKVLAQKCINIFTENTKELLQDNSFKDAALSTVKKIFSLNELNIDSEVDLINAAALYATSLDEKIVEKKASSVGINTVPDEKVMSVENNVKDLVETQNETDGPEQATARSSDTKNKTVNKQIRSVVKHIRLLTLTPQQYAGCTARSSLLTPSEDNAVLVNLVSNELSVPMPSGLSTSRIRRDKVGKARSKAKFSYTVQNFSTLKNWELSPIFYLRNLPWQIIASQVNEEGTKNLILGVRCLRESKYLINSSYDVNVELRLICHKPGAQNLLWKYEGVNWTRPWSFTEYLLWDTIVDLTRGYIQDDAITIEAHVEMEEPEGGI